MARRTSEQKRGLSPSSFDAKGNGREAASLSNEELRARLTEAEETLNAIRSGSVDALVVLGPEGEQVFTLEGADHNYRRLVEDMGEGAVVLNTEGDILYSNQRFATLVGAPLESVIGNSIRHYFAGRDQEALKGLLAQALDGTGKGELTLKTRNGDRAPAYLSAAGLSLSGVLTICLLVTDLTEQKRSEQVVAHSKRQLEQEQLRANKLESLGILAGGLAHDLNNSLTAILGNISLARTLAGSDGKIGRRLREAEMACMQAREVTEQLLTFSKGGAPVMEVASLDELLRDRVSFALSGSRVRYELEIASDLHLVEVDMGQIGRVIHNLVINARQAMPHGGTLTIRAKNVTLGPESFDNAVPLPYGEYVRIDVEDTGTGIPEKYLPMIFDPYFTTKEDGSGLGLSVAYSIVKSHGGHLTVNSHVGGGTTFHIYLPASSGVPIEHEEVAESSQRKKLRVLVMDDQEPVREVISEILVSFGEHGVTFASDGEDALEQYKDAMERGRPFDIVLMDLTIPGRMGGKEAISKLLEIDPQARAIVVSGYANDPIMSQYQDHGFRGVVRKPFAIDELLDTVQRVASDGA